MNLFPRLSIALARQKAVILSAELPTNIRRNLQASSVIDTFALFTPTGGSKVSADLLKSLRNAIWNCSDRYGFPEFASVINRQKFDYECSRLFFETMDISASEASKLEVWAHMTCVLLPDVVRWRFGGYEKQDTSMDRFIGSDCGRRRNTFGRLWWRAYLLRVNNASDPYQLLSYFGEDDLVQITERPSLAGSPSLATEILVQVLGYIVTLSQKYNERDLLREAVKRIRRLLPLIDFDSLTPSQRSEMIQQQILLAEHGLSKQV